MFQQYQRQESATSLGTVRTVSGTSQSSETVENVNGGEETAPSTIIELTVKELSPDSASSSTLTSGPQDTPDERGSASITVSNILARVEEEEPKLLDGGLGHAIETDSTVAQKHEKGEDTNEQEVVTEMPSDEDGDNLRGSGSNQDEALVRDSATTSASDDAQTPKGDEEKHINKDESSNSTTENPLNETDAKLPAASEQEEMDQMSPETSARLDNSTLGGASGFDEDLVDVSSVSDQIQPSDAEIQEESSSASAAAGDEGEDEHEGDQGMRKDHEETQVSVSGLLQTDTCPSQTPEQSVTEAAEDEQCSSVCGSAPADTTLPSPAQEVASDPSPLHHQPSETSDTSGDKASQKTADSVSKTKEIKIARLDVSNVALDTERLELKEASVVCSPLCTFT